MATGGSCRQIRRDSFAGRCLRLGWRGCPLQQVFNLFGLDQGFDLVVLFGCLEVLVFDARHTGQTRLLQGFRDDVQVLLLRVARSEGLEAPSAQLDSAVVRAGRLGQAGDDALAEV